MQQTFSAMLGPVFAKEMVELARRARYYFNRVFYGAVLLFVLFVVWEEYGSRLRWGGGLIQAMAEMASAVQIAVTSVQYGAVYLFVPLFLCGVIASEREERTIDLLFATDLRNREIVLGKLASRLVVLVLIIASALPVLSLLMLFGGIDPAGLWRSQACTLMAMLFVGAHAVYFSTASKSPIAALVRTYWWLGLWILAVPIAATVIEAELRRAPPILSLVVLVPVNPLVQFAVTLDDWSYNTAAARLGAWFFPATFLLPTLWSGIVLWRAVRRLRREPTPLRWKWPLALFRKLGTILGRIAPSRWRQAAAAEYQATRAAWVRRSNQEVASPLWQRARWARVYDREGYIGRIQWGGWALVAFFLLIAIDDVDDDEVAMAFLGCTWLAVLALAAILAATSVVSDRRRGFLDLVLASPLAASEFVDGTMLAVWQHLRRTAWLPCALYVFFWLTGAVHFWNCLFSLITAALSVTLVVAAGTLSSFTARSLGTALVVTFMFPVVTLVVLAFFIGIFEDAHGPVLWVVTAASLAGTWYWTRLRSSAAAVGCHFIAVHLAIASVATCWTFDGREDEFPVSAMHPGFVTLASMERRSNLEIPGTDISWLAVLPAYWTALVCNFVWVRRWMIRDFDRLVGRTRHAPDALLAPHPRAAPASAWLTSDL